MLWWQATILEFMIPGKFFRDVVTKNSFHLRIDTARQVLGFKSAVWERFHNVDDAERIFQRALDHGFVTKEPGTAGYLAANSAAKAASYEYPSSPLSDDNSSTFPGRTHLFLDDFSTPNFHSELSTTIPPTGSGYPASSGGVITP